MTEIKISFTKNKLENIPPASLRPGTKGIELEISTRSTLFELIGSGEKLVHPCDTNVPWQKIAFVFENNAEAEIYTRLTSSATNFELSFEKEKV